MSGIIEKHINGVDYDFWIQTGTVGGVLPKSETQVWSSGGGGYVDAQYGGVVHAPTVHSSTSHWKEVRVELDNGSAVSVTLHDGVAAFPGDRVSLFYGKPNKHERGYLHGLKNHREDRWWTFNCDQLVKPEYKNGPEAIAFRLSSRGFLSFLGGIGIFTVLQLLVQAPFYILNPIAFVLTLPDVFLLSWPSIITFTVIAAILVRTAYRLEKGSASKKASKALLSMAAYTEDKAALARNVDPQPVTIAA